MVWFQTSEAMLFLGFVKKNNVHETNKRWCEFMIYPNMTYLSVVEHDALVSCDRVGSEELETHDQRYLVY